MIPEPILFIKCSAFVMRPHTVMMKWNFAVKLIFTKLSATFPKKETKPDTKEAVYSF